MNSSSSSMNSSCSSWYNLQAERLRQSSSSSSSRSLGGGGGSSHHSNCKLYIEEVGEGGGLAVAGGVFDRRSVMTQQQQDSLNSTSSSSFRSQGLNDTCAAADSGSFRFSNPQEHLYSFRQVQTAMDIGQLPTDDDLTKSRRAKKKCNDDRILQKRTSRERSIQKQTLRGRLQRMRGNKKKKQESLESNNEHENDDDEDSNKHDHDDDDHDKNNSRDEETGGWSTDSDSNHIKNGQNDTANEINKKVWWLTNLFSINPYKPVHIMMDLAPGEQQPPPRTTDPSCCRRYLSERNPCYDWYLIQDKLIGKRFDIQETFCPTSRCAQGFKAASSSLVVCSFLFSIMQFQGPFISGYLKYLEHWGLFLSTLYMLLSMINSLLGAKQPWLSVIAVQGRIRWSWMLFMVASHIEVIMTVVYWSLIHEPGITRITFLIVMKYGGVAIQVFLDGLYINRIPLRWMFYWGMLWFVDIFYIFYSLLYTFYLSQDDATAPKSPVAIPIPGQQVQQPAPTQQETEQPPLYPFLDWKGDWQYALIFSVIFVCALSPAVHLFLWLSSLYRWPFCLCCSQEYRRYFVVRKAKTREERRLEREELSLRKQREREEAANAVAADMVHHDNLQKANPHLKQFLQQDNLQKANRCNRNGDNQSLCDTTANESSTCWSDSFSTMASGGAGSCNDHGSYQVFSAAAGGGCAAASGAYGSGGGGDSACGNGGGDSFSFSRQEDYDALASSSSSSSSPLCWQSHFAMGDIDEEDEDAEESTITRRGEDFVDDDECQDSKPAAVRTVGRF